MTTIAHQNDDQSYAIPYDHHSEVSFMLLENIYSTGVTHENHYMMTFIIQATDLFEWQNQFVTYR